MNLADALTVALIAVYEAANGNWSDQEHAAEANQALFTLSDLLGLVVNPEDFARRMRHLDNWVAS